MNSYQVADMQRNFFSITWLFKLVRRILFLFFSFIFCFSAVYWKLFIRCYATQPFMNRYRFFQNHHKTPCIVSFWQLPDDCFSWSMKLWVASKCFWPSSSLRMTANRKFQVIVSRSTGHETRRGQPYRFNQEIHFWILILKIHKAN